MLAPSSGRRVAGALRSNRLDQAFRGRVDPIFELSRVEPANGVADDQQFGLDLPRPGLREHQWTERVRRDDERRDTSFLEFDTVVETPR
tara:strand:+ start:380 stop:646 length:267 start_codon:yes stop_codon:yes gene_type:complete